MRQGSAAGRRVLLAALLACAGTAAQAQDSPATNYPTMASAPDPRDFVGRADAHLTLLGDPIRFAGANISWLGLRAPAGNEPAAIPSDFEVQDALTTALSLGGTIVRATTLGASVGCPQCLQPTPGHFNAAAFAHFDTVLADAHDRGIKFIIPLAGGPQDCGKPDPAAGSLCFFVRARGGHDAAAFFTDPAIRADFIATATAIVTHTSSLTLRPYSEAPTIMAWENCDGCGAGIDPAILAGWSEAVGQAIHAADPHHLYENGAFAGRIDPASPNAAPASAWATPSVDIVGDTTPPKSNLPAAAGAVAKADRAYVVDSFAWSPATLPTQDDLETFLDSLARQHVLSGALVGGLEAHADAGGYLPPQPGETALYFPGLNSQGTAAADMQTRDRALYRFSYRMQDMPPPAFQMPPKPAIISATHGLLTWRGAAGAFAYRIERSSDLVSIGSWSVVCDRCVDTAGSWQDPHPLAGPAWYRITPLDANLHAARPSPPFQNK